jgi:hypothetical protein
MNDISEVIEDCRNIIFAKSTVDMRQQQGRLAYGSITNYNTLYSLHSLPSCVAALQMLHQE